MKKFSNLSINVKLPILVGASSLAVMAFICVLLIFPLRSGSLKDSSEIARLSAVGAGERLAEFINGSANVVRAYSGVIAHLTESDAVPNEKKREALLEQMNILLISEKTLNNIWCILEPNALDGMDSCFVNRMGSNAQGIFCTWMKDGKMTVEKNVHEAELYRVPKTTGREMISEPYSDTFDGKVLQMFSISIPIMLDGKFIGVVGTDFYVNDLNKLFAKLNDNANGKLVTSEGVIAVNHDLELIGKPSEYVNREILNKLSDGKMIEGMYTVDGKKTYKVYVPVLLGNGNKAWFYAVDVSKNEIYAKARNTEGYLIALCTIGIVLIVLAGWLPIRTLLKEVTCITDIIRQLSSGHIHLHIDESQKLDELGMMKNELRRLVEGLKHTADFAQNIGNGNLDIEYRLLSDNDVLGNSLLEMRQNLQVAEKKQSIRAKEEEQRSWGTSGLAKFAEILRKDNGNIETLSYNIISNMVKYLNANQGGLFVLNEADREEDKILEMTACYAFDRKKYAEKQIRPGEGLVGTCYLEGETIYMTDVPDEYITITSGLGDANPRAVLICPLMVNDEIFGVVELASFHPFEPYQLEFVQKVSESIAATISSVRANTRTERLLAKTQLQTEEMANQEEELRQNMEEMQATQEDMRRRETELNETLVKMQEMQTVAEEKEHEMLQVYHTIFDVSNVVEFSAEGVITNINQNLIAFFSNADRNTFIGKHSAVFIGEEATNAAWANLRQGKTYENAQTVNTGVETIQIRQKFVPICNRNGELMRVFSLVFPENV